MGGGERGEGERPWSHPGDRGASPGRCRVSRTPGAECRALQPAAAVSRKRAAGPTPAGSSTGDAIAEKARVVDMEGGHEARGSATGWDVRRARRKQARSTSSVATKPGRAPLVAMDGATEAGRPRWRKWRVRRGRDGGLDGNVAYGVADTETCRTARVTFNDSWLLLEGCAGRAHYRGGCRAHLPNHNLDVTIRIRASGVRLEAKASGRGSNRDAKKKRIGDRARTDCQEDQRGRVQDDRPEGGVRAPGP